MATVKTQSALLCTFVALSIACNKQKEKVTDDPPPPRKENPDDSGLAGGGGSGGGAGGGSSDGPYQNLTKEDILSEILSSNEVYAPGKSFATLQKLAEQETAEDPVKSCLQAALPKLPIAANKTMIGIGLEADATDCANSAGKLDYKFLSVKIKLRLIQACEGDGIDLSIYNGKTLQEFDPSILDNCTKYGDLLTLQNPKRIERQELDDNQVAHPVQMTITTTQLHGTNEKEMKPCYFTFANGVATQQDKAGCLSAVQQKRTDVTIDGKPATDKNLVFEKVLVQQNLSYAEDGSEDWYRTGITAFWVNDWTGKLTYVDGVTAPNYELSRGSEKYSGSVKDLMSSFAPPETFTLAPLTTANKLITLPLLR